MLITYGLSELTLMHNIKALAAAY